MLNDQTGHERVCRCMFAERRAKFVTLSNLSDAVLAAVDVGETIANVASADDEVLGILQLANECSTKSCQHAVLHQYQVMSGVE